MSEFIVVNRGTGASYGPVEAPRAEELRDALLGKGHPVTMIRLDTFSAVPIIPRPSDRLVVT